MVEDAEVYFLYFFWLIRDWKLENLANSKGISTVLFRINGKKITSAGSL